MGPMKVDCVSVLLTNYTHILRIDDKKMKQKSSQQKEQPLTPALTTKNLQRLPNKNIILRHGAGLRQVRQVTRSLRCCVVGSISLTGTKNCDP